MSKSYYRPDIDGLRAVAVLSVVIYHLNPVLLPAGFLGVDIFFVISGYLISSIIFREQANFVFSLANFYSRRIRRIFPALIVVLGATIVFGYFSLYDFEYKQLAQHAQYAITFLLNFRLIDEAGYFDVSSHMKPLLHLWSLSVEEQFYLVWPIMVILAGRKKLTRTMLLVICFVSSYLFIIYLAYKNIDALFYHPLGRFWELLAGASLAHCQQIKGVASLSTILDRRWMSNLLSSIGFLLITVPLFAFCGKGANPSPLTLLPIIGVMSIIANQSGFVNKFLSLRPMVFVGLISYPIYLWHWPVFSYIRIMELGTPPFWLLFLGAVLSFFLAWLTYVFVEKSFRYRFITKNSVVSLCSVMIFLFIAAYGITLYDGLPDRDSSQYAVNSKEQMVREPSQDQDCINLFKNKDEAPVYCRYNKQQGSKGIIAIVGDSHAHVLFPGIAELASKKKFETLMLANSGCPTFIGTMTGRNDIEKNQCIRNINKILSFVENNKNIVTVIIASRGPQYLTGNGFGPTEIDGPFPPIYSQKNENWRKPSDIFESGLLSTINSLQKNNKKVAYFIQVPELGINAIDCIGRPLSILNRKNNMPSYSSYKDRMKGYRAIIARIKTETPELSVVDVEHLFCDSSNCYGMMDGKLLYADNNHLSVFGSRRVAPVIIEALGL
jgi:peptidoglycan/LPS O-acetylase OafA/YrhL